MEKILEQIRAMCLELNRKYPKYYKTERDPKLCEHLQVPDGETVLLCHDDTLFRSGKDGFVITEKGFRLSTGSAEKRAAHSARYASAFFRGLWLYTITLLPDAT